MASNFASSSVCLVRDAPEKIREVTDSRVQSVAALMRNGFQKHFTLSELAKSVNLTPEHLCRLFKRELGMSPFRYLKLCRLQHACVLLETSHLSVKQIMFIVGYSDESHFVREFENTLGLSPMRYRNSQGKGSNLECYEAVRTHEG